MQQAISQPNEVYHMQVDPLTLPDDDIRCWMPPQLLAELFPAHEVQQIKFAVRQREVNGLDGFDAVTIFGRKAYIHCNRYAQWFNSRINSKRAINSSLTD